MDISKELRALLDEALNLGGRAQAWTEATPLIGAVPELDSMGVVAVLTALEDRLGLSIDDDEIDGQVFESFGTLLAFSLVCAGVLVLRRTQPGLPRPFRTPWVPLVPGLGIVICVLQMFSLPTITWLNLAIWMVLGFIVYFGYSRKHSKLARPNG